MRDIKMEDVRWNENFSKLIEMSKKKYFEKYLLVVQFKVEEREQISYAIVMKMIFRITENVELFNELLNSLKPLSFLEMKLLVDTWVTPEQKNALEERILEPKKQTKLMREIKKDFFATAYLAELCIEKMRYSNMFSWIKASKRIEHIAKKEKISYSQADVINRFGEIYSSVLELVVYETMKIYPELQINEASDQVLRWFDINESRNEIHMYQILHKEKADLINSLQYLENYFGKKEAIRRAFEQLS